MVRRVHSVRMYFQSAHTWPGDSAPEEDGYIEPSKPREEVRQDPYPLPKDFEWSVIDITDPAQVWTRQSHTRYASSLFSSQIKEAYELLSANYVEDDQAAFRFQYTAEFLEWYAMSFHSYAIIVPSFFFLLLLRALKPPGWHKEWHIGVRVSSNRKLVAFISGVPIRLRVRKKWDFLHHLHLVVANAYSET